MAQQAAEKSEEKDFKTSVTIQVDSKVLAWLTTEAVKCWPESGWAVTPGAFASAVVLQAYDRQATAPKKARKK